MDSHLRDHMHPAVSRLNHVEPSIQPNGHFPRVKADKSDTIEGNVVQRNQNHVHFREYSKI